MYNFNYHRPASVAEAAAAARRHGDAKLMAGGQTFIPTLKQRLAQPTDLIDLGGIAELKGIKEEAGGLTIGAMTRHADVAGSAVVKARDPGAGRAGRADRRPAGAQPRHHRRLDQQQRPGGRLSGRAPGAGATVRTNKREIPADDFFTGMFETALAPTRSSPRCISRSRRRAPTSSSRTRPAATRWSACSSPGPAAACAWRSPAPARARSAGPTPRTALAQNFAPARHRRAERGRRRAQQRHPRQRRVPRAPDQGDGQARRRSGRLTAARRGADRPLPPPHRRPRLRVGLRCHGDSRRLRPVYEPVYRFELPAAAGRRRRQCLAACDGRATPASCRRGPSSPPARRASLAQDLVPEQRPDRLSRSARAPSRPRAKPASRRSASGRGARPGGGACEADYRRCFAGCGGTVVEERRCVANCPS